MIMDFFSAATDLLSKQLSSGLYYSDELFLDIEVVIMLLINLSSTEIGADALAGIGIVPFLAINPIIIIAKVF
jgi:hypothetical protein